MHNIKNNVRYILKMIFVTYLFSGKRTGNAAHSDTVTDTITNNPVTCYCVVQKFYFCIIFYYV